MRRLLAILLLLSCALALSAQKDTLPPAPAEGNTDLLEDLLQNTDADAVGDFNTLFESLGDYLRKPLNINKADEADLRDLLLLNDVQIAGLLRHRAIAGDLISVYELQAVPGFTPELIRSLMPYITVGGDLDDYQVSIKEMLRDGSNELYLRWARVLEQQKGFTTAADTADSRYLGDPNQYYLRFRHSYGTKLSIGLTAEKDRGEQFFAGANRYGFDFYSAHIALRNYNRTIKAVVLGDYAVSFGQGLIMLTGFNYGKTIQSVGLKRGGR
ncbi:MAG TPA: helix-hairpin-helix domain-containing protein, partial [Saprospiraceae bacterium]|nr:helix-hairpin-helix domain-containing protein [Saprospiraceae bacterium]